MRTGANWWSRCWVGCAFAASTAWSAHAQAQTASFPDVNPPAAPPSAPPPPPPPQVQPTAPVPPPPGPPLQAPYPEPSYPATLPPPPAPPVQSWQPTQQSSSLNLLPPILPYRQGMPVPPGYSVEQRPATGLIAGGLLTFGAAYAAAIIIAAGQNFENGTGWLAAPIVGPWGAIGARTFKCTVPLEQSRKCVNQAFDEVETLVFMTADGLVQATGAALFIVGLASGKQELVRNDVKKISVVPRRVGDDGFGLGISGVF